MSNVAANLECFSNTADRLLARLDGVERHGGAWRARCPTHGSDRNRSLSIAVGDDGRALVHCFAGCETTDVLQAIGLELADLFPDRITHATTNAERRKLRQAAKQAQWAAALEVLQFEARVIAVAGDQIARGEALNGPDQKRLLEALERVQRVREVLRGR